MVNTKIRLIIFFAAKDGEALHSQQKQDRELTVAAIMNSLLPNSDKLKKVGITTRPFRYDLNQIPYDYTVEVRNRFKGLGLIDREHDELWMEVHDIVQETGIKTIPMEKKCKRQNGCYLPADSFFSLTYQSSSCMQINLLCIIRYVHICNH